MNTWHKNYRLSFLIVFLSVLIIFLFQSIMGGFGFNLNYSISRYVGLTATSAAIFLLCNIANLSLLFPTMRAIKRHFKLNLVWYIISVIMLCALLSLSICPVGLYDSTWGKFGLVSTIHRISAAIMFVSALLLSALTLKKIQRNLPLFVDFVIFIAYGVFFVVGYCNAIPLVIDNVLLFESVFLLWFLLNFSLLPEK